MLNHPSAGKDRPTVMLVSPFLSFLSFLPLLARSLLQGEKDREGRDGKGKERRGEYLGRS